jgi:hypothetical protein
MKIIAILSHIFMIGFLALIFFRAGTPERAIDWVWRILFILLPLINLYVLFKLKKVKMTK